jgi:ribosomal protein S13
LTLPPLTPDQRAAALEKAAKARKERAEVKFRLKHGATTLPEVLKEGQTDDVVGKMKLSALLESMPGVGKVRAKQIMERLGISESRRVRGLGANQRATLESEFREGWSTDEPRGLSPKNKHDANDEISVAIFLDTDVPATIASVLENLDELVEALGYKKPVKSTVERGSFFGQSWAKVKKTLTSDDMKELKAKTERALELRLLDRDQAEVDNKIAEALTKIVASLADVQSACVRAGSILLVKYTGPQGSVILTRNLSPLEIRAFEKFPEIQKEPQKALESLALAISDLTEPKAPTV